jgi:hypothetical protein
MIAWSSSILGDGYRANKFEGGGAVVSPLQVYLIGASCVVVFMACIFLVADDYTSSFDDATPHRRRGCGGRREGIKSPRKRKNRSIGHPLTIGLDDKQMVSDASNVKLELTSSIGARENSYQLTKEKMSAPNNAASPSDYASVFSIHSRVGNDDPYILNNVASIQNAGQLATETRMKNSCKNRDFEETDELGSRSGRNSEIDWVPSSAASYPPKRCKTSMLPQESLMTYPTSQCTMLVADKSNLVTQMARLTVLVSNGVYDYYQASNQRATLSLLRDLGIPHDVLDGMDASQRERRDAFFKISGIRGNYPQIFLTSTDGDEVRFLGGYDWLNNIVFNDLEAILVVKRDTPGNDEPS